MGKVPTLAGLLWQYETEWTNVDSLPERVTYLATCAVGPAEGYHAALHFQDQPWPQS